jgi:hypothetical protein
MKYSVEGIYTVHARFSIVLCFIAKTVGLRSLLVNIFGGEAFSVVVRSSSPLHHNSTAPLYDTAAPAYNRRLTTSKDDVSKFLTELTDALVLLEGFKSAMIRKRYTHDICHALAGITYLKPVIFYTTLSDRYSGDIQPVQGAVAAGAAAVGNVDMLRMLTSAAGDLFRISLVFPNALCAAVATSQDQVLRWMLQYLKSAGTEVSVPGALKAVGDALSVAVRTYQKDMGHMIIKYLSAALFSGIEYEGLQCVVPECMRTGNIELLLPILELRQTRDIVQLRDRNWIDLEVNKDLAITDKEVDILFLEGSCYGFQELIQRGIIQPNKMGRHLPLDRAVHGNRHDLARILLKSGADINARDRNGEGLSALQYAARRGYSSNVKFLIQNGADPVRSR